MKRRGVVKGKRRCDACQQVDVGAIEECELPYRGIEPGQGYSYWVDLCSACAVSAELGFRLGVRYKAHRILGALCRRFSCGGKEVAA